MAKEWDDDLNKYVNEDQPDRYEEFDRGMSDFLARQEKHKKKREEIENKFTVKTFEKNIIAVVDEQEGRYYIKVIIRDPYVSWKTLHTYKVWLDDLTSEKWNDDIKVFSYEPTEDITTTKENNKITIYKDNKKIVEIYQGKEPETKKETNDFIEKEYKDGLEYMPIEKTKDGKPALWVGGGSFICVEGNKKIKKTRFRLVINPTFKLPRAYYIRRRAQGGLCCSLDQAQVPVYIGSWIIEYFGPKDELGKKDLKAWKITVFHGNKAAVDPSTMPWNRIPEKAKEGIKKMYNEDGSYFCEVVLKDLKRR